MTDSLIYIGRCCGMEMNMDETKVIRMSRQPSPIHIMISETQLENVEYFRYLGNMVRNYVSCTREIKSRISHGKAAFNKKQAVFTSKLDFNFRNKPVNCYIWSIAWYGAES
jgi:hypothetical protein